MSNMDAIVQWATILSPIIAVLVAVWVVISSKKDTDKQIESIKTLSKLHVEVLLTEIDMDMQKSLIIIKQAEEERQEMRQIMDIHMLDFRDLAWQDYKAKTPERNLKYTKAYFQELSQIKNKLTKIKEEIN